MPLTTHSSGASLSRPDFITDRGLDWYVQWSATILALIHVWFVSHDIESWYKITGVAQAGLWLWLGILWRQTPIILLNIIMVGIYLKGIVGL